MTALFVGLVIASAEKNCVTATVPPTKPVCRRKKRRTLQLLPLLRPAYRAIYPTGPDRVGRGNESLSVCE